MPLGFIGFPKLSLLRDTVLVMARAKLICTHDATAEREYCNLFEVGELYSEADFRERLAEHVSSFGDGHLEHICIIIEGDLFWNEFHALQQSTVGPQVRRLEGSSLGERMIAKAKGVALPKGI